MQIKRYNSAPALQIWALFLCNYSAISPHIRLFHPFSTLVSPLFYSCFAPVSLLFYSCFAPHSPGAVFTALLPGHTFHRSLPRTHVSPLLPRSRFHCPPPRTHFSPLSSSAGVCVALLLADRFRPLLPDPALYAASLPLSSTSIFATFDSALSFILLPTRFHRSCSSRFLFSGSFSPFLCPSALFLIPSGPNQPFPDPINPAFPSLRHMPRSA